MKQTEEITGLDRLGNREWVALSNGELTAYITADALYSNYGKGLQAKGFTLLEGSVHGRDASEAMVQFIEREMKQESEERKEKWQSLDVPKVTLEECPHGAMVLVPMYVERGCPLDTYISVWTLEDKEVYLPDNTEVQLVE